MRIEKGFKYHTPYNLIHDKYFLFLNDQKDFQVS